MIRQNFTNYLKLIKLGLFLVIVFAQQQAIAENKQQKSKQFDDELSAGLKHFEAQDYAKAAEVWRPLAQQGDSRAQYNLALIKQRMYQQNGETVDSKSAQKYLAMSRSTGLVDSFFMRLNTEKPVIKHKVKKSSRSIANGSQELAAKNQEHNNSMPLGALAWLNQQTEKNYTLQLATGKSKPHLDKMKRKLADYAGLSQPEHLFIHKIKNKKQVAPRYILVYGVFDSYSNAKEEVKKLPESYIKANPWIRQFGVLQSIVIVEQEQNKTL